MTGVSGKNPLPCSVTCADLTNSVRDKVRIIALYIMHRDGVPDEDRKRLYQHARLGPPEMDAINNLPKLGQEVTKAGLESIVACHPSKQPLYRTRKGESSPSSNRRRSTMHTTFRAISLLSSLCLKSTLPANWIDKHFPLSVILLLQQTMLLCAATLSARQQAVQRQRPCEAPNLDGQLGRRENLTMSRDRGQSSLLLVA